ncbi:copper amine oxidase-like protein [Fontibacillus phaseoli]|uniref:Copper amine oxidase-like protein n=1 Tax=Fontibacillus phaseoli TaxID=1416533 RepID=A0A369BGK5_9BACL|nr:copper amine oxidase-like protein [Fontibacillus phaseoli]
MKRTVIPGLLALLAFICLIPSSLAAAPAAAPKSVVLIDAKSGRAFAPISFLKGFAGAEVQWTDAEKRIDIADGDNRLALFTGKTTAQVNEAQVSLTDAPFSENGTTYVPLQFVSQMLGYSLEWSKNPSVVSISRDGNTVVLPAVTRGAFPSGSKPIVSASKTFKVGSRSFSVQMITVSLLHPKIGLDVVLAGNKAGNVEDLSSIAKRSKAAVAINGTFFDAYTKIAIKHLTDT